MQRFKFQGRRDALQVLLPPLVERVADLRFDAIVPVPRHAERIRAQGCDPAWTLARRLGRETGVAVLDRALVRSRAVPPQTDLPPEARRRNVRASFRALPGTLAGRRVLLLDDVVTTGATLAEAARALVGHAAPRAVLPAALAATPEPAL